MVDNPFSKKKQSEFPDEMSRAEKPAEQASSPMDTATDVCPFLTNNALAMGEPPPEIKFQARGQVGPIPVLATNYNYCIEKACKFWYTENEGGCSIKRGMDNMSRIADVLELVAKSPLFGGKG